MKPVERVTICGGGNGAHALLAALLQKGLAQVSLYLPLDEELDRFQDAKARGEPFRLIFKGESSELSLAALSVTQDPVEAVAADLIILVLPAFAHQTVLEKLAPFLQSGTIVAALPARGGLEFQAADVLSRHDCRDITIAGFQTLPWACRIREYARGVEVLGRKRRVGFATLPPHRAEAVAGVFNDLLEPQFVPYGNMLELTLANTGQIIHPGIMVGAFAHRLNELYRGSEIPAFYTEVGEATATLLEEMSREIANVKRAVEDRCDVKLPAVVPISQWLLESYEDDIADKSGLARMFQTNRSYRGLRVPTRPVGDGRCRIDTRTRYLTEDVPYGLLVSRAIAELANVATPEIDRVIKETSGWNGVEYLKDGKLAGKEIAKSRIPQNFELNSLEAVIELVTANA